MDPDLVIVAFLLLLSALTSACETALLSLTPAQVRTLVENEVKGALYLAKLKKDHHKTLITILVLNNFLNIAASALTTVVMTRFFGDAGIGIAMGALTLVLIVFGEIIPKSIATTYAKNVGTLFALPLYWVGVVLTPLISILDWLVNAMLKFFGAQHHIQVTDEELIAMASIGAEEGSIDKGELELIENVLEFNDIEAQNIMTPRVHIDALPESFDVDDATEFAMNHTHTRLPVYRDNIDNIVGILSLKTLLKAYHQEEEPSEVTLRQITLLTPLKVPESIHVKDLFHLFKKKRQHMAILLDEHGGTSGLVTMEDLLEELVGDIEDEQDTEEEKIKKISDSLYELSGRVELDDLAELTGLEFDHPEYKTLSFLIMDTLGYLPRVGQSITLGNWQFEVKQMLRNVILKVEAKKLN